MKPIKITTSLLIIVIAVISAISLSINIIRFYSSISLDTIYYINETLNLLLVVLVFFVFKSRSLYSEPSVQQNLKNFIKSLAALFILVIICKLILNPVFSLGIFPQQPETLPTVFYSSIIALASIAFLMLMIIAIKNLINYKLKKRNRLYFILALIFASITAIFTLVFETPLALNFEGEAIYGNSAFLVTLFFLLLLSWRNSWITYLTRKEKYYYFLISIVVIWLISFLFDFAFKVPVTAHSLALGVFANLGWFFLVFYSIFATAYLMLQLPTARAFDRKMKEVSSLSNLSRAIGAEYDFNKLVRMVTDMSSEVIESSFTWIEIYEEENHRFMLGASKNFNQDDTDRLKNQDKHIISEKIIEDKKPYLIHDVSKHEIRDTLKDWSRPVGSLAGIPLLSSKGKIFGILYAAKSEPFGFYPDDVNLLEAYANQAAIAIENAQLIKLTLAQERMEKELQIAREVQLRLLPQNTPQFDHAEIETLAIAAYEVGGDYYDFFGNSGSKIGLVIGDVSGKGTSAAFYMAETKGIIQSLARNYDSPRDILIHANKLLYSSMEKKSFISLLTAIIDMKKMTICFARAGHCPLIHYKADEGKTRMFQSEGIAVGLDSGDIFDRALEEKSIKLKTNDILVLFTDGLSEARNNRDEEFGEERLCEIVRLNATLPLKELKDKVIDEILKFSEGQSLHDDLTLVMIKFT